MLEKTVQIILFQGLFLLLYVLFFRKETFYQLNRFYLLMTSLLAVTMPFIEINITSKSNMPAKIIALGEVLLNTQNSLLPEVFLNANSTATGFSAMLWIYFIGVLVSFSLFIWKLAKIRLLIRSSKQQKKKDFVLVALKDSTSVFSFLNYVFIGEKNNNKIPIYLLTHEKVHVTQMHSLDLLWFELLKIALWFNPLVYLYQKQITALHEFIADAESVKVSDTKTYYNHILNDLFQVENMAFINQFYNKSLIKKRIIMMTQAQSNPWKKVKYLILLPILVVMLTIGCNSVQETEDTRQEYLQNWADFIYAHENSRNLSQTQYKEYIKLLKIVNPDKKIKSFEEYKAAVNGSKDFHLYQVSPANDDIHSRSTKKHKDEGVPLTLIDEVPIYPGCEDITNKAEQRACLSRKIQEHVAKNFNVALAQDLGLTPGKKRIFVIFKIDKDGNITGTRARAPHKDLEEEAIRVVKLLPKMKPGEQDGKAVSIKYSLPITFLVEE